MDDLLYFIVPGPDVSGLPMSRLLKLTVFLLDHHRAAFAPSAALATRVADRLKEAQTAKVPLPHSPSVHLSWRQVARAECR